MRLHGLALLASASLALANLTACGARGSSSIGGDPDAGGAGDVPVATTDMGMASTDNGAPTDNGTVTPTDNGAPACAAPRTTCAGTCVDTQSDQAHCGACGRACSGGQICNNGSCQATSTCTAPRMVCDGACVNTRTDVENCGACGRACADGQFCNAGTCMATTTACTAPRVACDGTCVDTRTDGANCGSCGRACPSGQFCSDGACRSTSECATPRMTCGASCIDITSDVFNCGACNRRCGDGQACSGSRCVGGTPTCPSGTMLCGTRCIDVSDDPSNCGACGRACSAGTTCVTGSCMAVATGFAAGGTCTGDTCGGAGELQCVRFNAGGYCTGLCDSGNTSTEQASCGGAGTTCLTGVPLNVPANQGLCTRACNPAATSESTGGCRPGMVCTGFWSSQEGSIPDSPGCFPFCRTDSDCVGATSGDAGAPRCNPRVGFCGPTGINLALSVDGDACNPASIQSSGVNTCRGVCFRVSDDTSQGVCGSYLNLGVATSCPDNPTLILPRAPGNDNRAICVFKSCSRNSECASPLRCVYPEGAGTVRSDLGAICSYATALQPGGIP